jgi:uncharacterized UPF0146 family protein
VSREFNTAVLDKLFEPVSECFTPEVARRIAALRAPPEVQAQLDDLADKCDDGTLSAEERTVYEAYLRAVNFIGVLQAKARALLARGG